MKTIAYICLAFVFGISCTNPTKEKQVDKAIENPTNTVRLSSDIVWEQLNPARGDQSPLAGTIWGDRKGNEATGFLAKFVDGFSSPPHIHNVSYRAVVIKGLIHNDDPNAETTWMPAASFWTQAVGESHITAAKGQENIALVEIDRAPYLVKPITEAFDDGERSINIDVSNIVWLDSNKTNWIGETSKAALSFLTQAQDSSGLQSLFVKLPKGYQGKIESNASVFHAVVIQGDLTYEMPNTKALEQLDAGSYFGATDRATHQLTNSSNNENIIYIRTNGAVKIY